MSFEVSTKPYAIQSHCKEGFMEYSIKPSEEGDCIILKVVGEFTAKSMLKCTVEAHTLGQEMDIHWYFVDVTNARNIDTPYNNYKFAYQDLKMTEGTDPLAKVVCLVSPDDHSHDFIETVAYNAGVNAGIILKLFREPAEAKAYLAKMTSQK